jgi:hypothetical protein
MVACNSIGYFNPSAMWPSSHLDSLSFISLLCHPQPTTPCYIIRTQTWFFSGPPPCCIIPPFDAQTHLGSKSIILI